MPGWSSADDDGVDPLIYEPHHDGSPLYLGRGVRPLGSDVPRPRAHQRPPRLPTRSGCARSRTPSRSSRRVRASERVDGGTIWWRGTVHVRNPVQRYRFLVVDRRLLPLAQPGRPPRPTTSPTRTTSSAHDVRRLHRTGAATGSSTRSSRTGSPARPGPSDRPTPAWAVPAALDRPARSTRVRTRRRQLYGGDLDGIVEHLDHLAAARRRHALPDPGLPGARATTATTPARSTGSTRCSAATPPTGG